MASFVRESSYRHVTATLHPREQWYEALNTASSQSESDLLSASSSAVAYVDNGGGGCVLAVLPLSSYGKNHVPITATTYRQPLIRAHSQPVMDFAFDRFNESRVLTCSTDGLLKLWQLPEEGLVEDLSTPALSLSAADSVPLRGLATHPSCSNLVAMRASKGLFVADLASGSVPITIGWENFVGDITGTCWSYSGDMIVTTGKDKTLRTVDPRAGAVTSETAAHDSIKASKAVCAGNSGLIITTGYTATVDREMCLWDPRQIATPLQRTRVDSGTGLLLPFYDVDTNLLFVVGRGDTNIRLYELSSGVLHPISSVTAGEVMRGATIMPRHGLDRAGNEIARVLKLVDKCIQPVRYEVPRRERLRYSTDLYPPTVYGSPAALNPEQWLAGETAVPILTAFTAPADAANTPLTVEGKEEEQPTVAESKTPTSPSTISPSRKGLKYRHVYGRENAKERSFFNLQPDTSAMDSPLITCSDRYWAVPYVGGGGPVYVSSITKFGKVEPNCAVLNGHRSTVTDLKFSPFDPSLLATGSDDSHICLWRIPEDDVRTSMFVEQALMDLSGHHNAVKTVDFHPTAEGVLVTSSMDLTIMLWDLNAQNRILSLRGGNEDSLNNISFSSCGRMFATASKDRIMRVIDPREYPNCPVVSTPEIGRNLRVQWCTSASGDEYADPILTVAAGAGGSRSLQLWDLRKPGTAICTRAIDNASGQLFPMYDEDTGICYIAGKGDTTIRFFEIARDELGGDAIATKANEFLTASSPITGVCMLSKRTCNVREMEIGRFLKLTTDSVIPISFTLPRAEGLKAYFHDDVFVPTRSGVPSLSCSEWFDRQNAEPIRHSIKPDGMINLSEKPAESPKLAKSKEFKNELDKAEKEAKERDASFNRLQQMAITRSKYHPNQSMGPVGIPGVDQTPIHDDDDDTWDD